MKVMKVKVNMMRMMSWHFSWHQITVTNRCLQQPKRCETRSCDSCQAPRCLQPLLLPAMSPKKATTDVKSKAKPKATAPDSERYDWERTVGPDRDPRTVGPPCHGEHVIAAPGRGSKSGANRHARWESCEACGLRLSYTPTWGSHGATRQAGPLPQDTKDQITEKKPDKNSIDLVDKKISYDAQQRSLEKQLKAVQQKKEEWIKIQVAKDAKTKGYTKTELDNKWIEAENKFLESSSQLAMGSAGTPLDPRENQFCPKMTPEELEAYQKQLEEMNHAPGRKARKAEESAEDLEYSQRTAEQGDWTLMPDNQDSK